MCTNDSEIDCSLRDYTFDDVCCSFYIAQDLVGFRTFYQAPTKYPPFGLSDHYTVSITPGNRKKSYNAKRAVTVRALDRPSEDF